MTSPTPSSFDVRQKQDTAMPRAVFLVDRILAHIKRIFQERRGRRGMDDHGRVKLNLQCRRGRTKILPSSSPLSSSLLREVSKNEDTVTRRERRVREREKQLYATKENEPRGERQSRGRRATYAPSNTSLAEGGNEQREKAMLSWRRSMEKKRERKKEGARSTQDVEKGLFECRIGMEMKFSRFR